MRILHSLGRKHRLPWHRVVNAKGEIAIVEEEPRMLQMLYLKGEGVEVDAEGRIDLEAYLYHPQPGAD